MIRKTFEDNPSYVKYKESLAQLHQLMKEGRDGDMIAEALRENMDTLWEGLNEEEKMSVRELSGNLYNQDNE